MKKLILGIIILFLVGSGCRSNSTTPLVDTPVSHQTTTSIGVTEKKLPATELTQEKMLTYKNKLYGFQFSYPATAKITADIEKTRHSNFVYAVSLRFSTTTGAFFEVYNKKQKDILEREITRFSSPEVESTTRTNDGLIIRQFIYQGKIPQPVGESQPYLQVNEYTEMGDFIIKASVTERRAIGTVRETIGANPDFKILNSLSAIPKDDSVGLKGQDVEVILDGLEFDHSNLVWGNYPILTREKLLEVIYGQVKDIKNGYDMNEETGFVAFNKYVRDNKIYVYLAAVQGCGGCFSPESTYLEIDPANDSLNYKSLDPAKNQFLFQRIPEIIISPDKLKGAYVSNSPGGDNNPNEPEVVWILDFTTGASVMYKKLPLDKLCMKWAGRRILVVGLNGMKIPMN